MWVMVFGVALLQACRHASCFCCPQSNAELLVPAQDET
jgi:hypothetical protein